ncbi:stealth conserved region 3 domain-containing protein [Streptococcus sp. H49]|uniref:stealth conserved region 3 domain-containing protein n=1 Tax=Streptococcus huangxiaojuni TaxID=3237239 RepID=UPI0034A25656
MGAIEKIDFVVLWVDDSDDNWLKEKARWVQGADSAAENPKLYRDYGTFYYWFRMVEQHAPWVNKIHLVTNGQLPEWLNTAHPKLNLVKHDDFIPSEYLPTFNSAAIELNLHRIPNLAEHFVLFNDDMFLVKDSQPEDFFVLGLPKLFAVYNPIVPNEAFSHVLFNNTEIICKYFPKKKAFRQSPFKFLSPKYGPLLLKNLLMLPWQITGYHNLHLPHPIRKSTLALLWQKEPEAFIRTSRHRIRDYWQDINHYLCAYWEIETGQFVPLEKGKGIFLTIDEVDKLPDLLTNVKTKMVCINDVPDAKPRHFKQLNDVLKQHYPNQSQFEQ